MNTIGTLRDMLTEQLNLAGQLRVQAAREEATRPPRRANDRFPGVTRFHDERRAVISLQAAQAEERATALRQALAILMAR